MNETMKTIHERRSTRSYKPEQITKEQLDVILDAGRWSPTARNEQEIYITVLQDKELLAELIREFSNVDERRGARFNYGAPTLFLLFGPRDFAYTQIDGGITVENMALAAESVGVGSVIIGCIREFMNGEKGKKWKERFGVPEDFVFVIGLAAGYINQPTPAKEREPGRVSFF